MCRMRIRRGEEELSRVDFIILCFGGFEHRSVSLVSCDAEVHGEQCRFDARERGYSEPHAQDWMN